MPGHIVHIEIALALLDGLPASQTPPWARHPESRNAYLHGALDPDLGLFPGGDPLVTDLSHHVKTADFLRNLVALATTELEMAYAWGWITHFMADTHLHPTINRACTAHLLGSSNHTTSWDESPSTHMRVELGLDAVRLVRDERLRSVRLRDFLTGPRALFLQSAFEHTYGFVTDGRSLRLGHQVLGRAQNVLFAFGDTVGRRHLGMPRRPRDLAVSLVYQPARWLVQLLPKDSIPYVVTHPLPPQRWLEETVSSALEELPARFAELLTGGLAVLPNLNLDTGEPLET